MIADSCNIYDGIIKTHYQNKEGSRMKFNIEDNETGEATGICSTCLSQLACTDKQGVVRVACRALGQPYPIRLTECIHLESCNHYHQRGS